SGVGDEPVAGGGGPATRFVAPGGSGSGDGRSWADAADLGDLPRLVTELEAGGTVLVLGDAGPYQVEKRINLRSGGAEGRPVVIQGVDSDGGPGARPVLQGSRTSPYDPDGETGREVFRLLGGASDLVFTNLEFRDQGIAFNAAGDVRDVTISDVSAVNVRRFFENYRADDEDSADVTGLTVRDVTIEGFSKGAVRLQNDSSDILLEDVVGDSQRQDKDDFAMGVHLDDTAHDITLRRVTMRNAHDSLHEYWNGDGFASERGNYDIRFEDTLATGNTDGGYDLKSSRTTLVRARAEDNKRNFRLWGTDVTATDCVGLDPNRRGGSSSQTQVWVGKDAEITLTGCTLTDDSPDTIVFDLAEDASLTVEDSRVEHSSEARLERTESGADLTVTGAR
ncbi:MAG: hypothetical protein M3P95_07650, partial [Actinomycetota bacterium]|nr:hypothetical protein [Actinomycetota bacterium]